MSTLSQEIGRIDTLGEKYGGGESTIESDFLEGRRYYELLVHWNKDEEIGDREDMLTLAMASCHHALTLTGTQRERLIKIDILLLMMDIVTLTSPINILKRERYFYRAVEIAKYSPEEDFLSTPHGQRIKEAYCTYIDPKFGNNFNNRECSEFLELMQSRISAESNKNISQRTEQARDSKNYISKKDTPEGILEKLEIALGPVRLVIIATESGEICTHHHIERSEAERLQENSCGIRTLQTKVLFDKEKRYEYLIDRGSQDASGIFNTEQIRDIIEPILSIYIERLEYEYALAHADHDACIHQHEEQAKIDTEIRDYSAFLKGVLSDTSLAGSRDGVEDIEYYTRAIDIARIVISHHRNKTHSTIDEFFTEIDTILGGKINRTVCSMVISILLARYETMHGTGYPSGLNQQKISLSGKIYSIIRAYETLTSMYPGRPGKVISTLENWGGGGYFDRRLLSLFIANISGIPVMPMREKQTPTDDRIDSYKLCQEQWEALITHIDEMSILYDEFRSIGTSEQRRKALVPKIDRERLEILRVADLANIIIIERHELDESNNQKEGAPGSPDDGLIPLGISNAIQKGEILRRLLIEIYTSPLPRAKKTTETICQRVYECIEKCIRCPRIQTIESLTNPAKNQIGGTLSFASRFIGLGEGRQKELRQLILDIISSSSQSIHLIITHGDVMRHLLFLIESLFDQEKFIGLRHDVGNATVHTLLFRGDRIVEWDLLFSISDWKLMLDTINIFTETIFGDIFYLRGDHQVSLIRLRDRFLDYIDLKNETNPEKVGEFIQALDENRLTAHFSAILRREGVIR
ncbi:hypothetical protein H7170_04325 [Candidatus Gracilibacteria bacterium]|nr:hypothetical protein [Candidatus Gracilibacteria bacterium]